jgi:transglutaminase-like putative cysteine protease
MPSIRISFKLFWDDLRDDLPSLLLVGLLLLVAAWSVVAAGWVEGIGLLPAVVLIGLLMGYLLAKSRFSELSSLVASLVYGWFTVWTLAGRLVPEADTFRERLIELNFRFATWIEQALGGGFSRDNLIFLLLVCLLGWYLSFNAAWALFRRRRLWQATVPIGLAMLINAYQIVGPLPVDLYLMIFLLLTLLLAVRTNAVSRERVWQHAGAGFRPDARFALFRGGVAAVIVLLALAWVTPKASANEELAALWEEPQGPWSTVEKTFQRLFNAVESQAPPAASYYGGATLSMGGPIHLSDTPVMTVFAPGGYRYYWRSRVFDTYTDGQWWARPDSWSASDFGILPQESSDPPMLRRNVQQRFVLSLPSTRLLYAAPQPQSFASLPVTAEVIYTTPGSDFATVSAVQARNTLEAGDVYGVTSAVSIADEFSLRQAGTSYPAWVTDHYLGLPPNITTRTRDLAAEIAAEAENPYDAARAVETYLRESIAYNEAVQPPPEDAEPVDYVLFESQEGYCTYYASAMTVMLRSLGIPARMVAGFSQGTFDPDLNGFVVLESDAHTWVQVYFPQYGWIDFEPTAARAPIVRQEHLSLDDLTTPEEETGVIPEAAEQDEEGSGIVLEDRGQAGFQASQFAEKGAFSWIPPLLRWLVPLVLLTAGGVAALWYWRMENGLRGLSDVARGYARLNIFAPWLGVDLSQSDTPHERVRAYRQVIPESEGPVRRIVDLYVEEQYTEDHLGQHRLDAYRQAREAWDEVRKRVLRLGLLRRIGRMNPFRDRDTTIR